MAMVNPRSAINRDKTYLRRTPDTQTEQRLELMIKKEMGAKKKSMRDPAQKKGKHREIHDVNTTHNEHTNTYNAGKPWLTTPMMRAMRGITISDCT